MADAVDGAAAQAIVKIVGAPAEQFGEHCIVKTVTHGKVRLAAGLRKTVPRADQLAIIAAVDTIADQRPQFLGNTAVVFDGQVGNAAPCIEPVRRHDRLRRTDVNAFRATAAVV